MAFERSLQDIVNKQVDALNKLESQFEAAAFRMYKKAARLSISMITQIANDPKIKKAMQTIGNFIDVTGIEYKGNAAKKVLQNLWNENVRVLSNSLSKVNFITFNIEQRLRKLSERQARAWSDSAKAQFAENDAISKINMQLHLNERIIKRLTAMRKGASLQEKANLDARINKLKAANEELKIAHDAVQGLGEKMRTLEFQEKIQSIRERAFGGIWKMRDKGGAGMDFIVRLFKNPAALFTVFTAGLVMAIRALWDESRKVLRTFNEAGMTPSQWSKAFVQVTDATRFMLSKGLIPDSEEISKAYVSISGILGRLTVPQPMLDQVAYMHKMFNLTNQEASQFLTTMFRFYNRNADFAVEVSNQVAEFAKANDMNINEVFKLMNKHAEDFAKSGNMSAIAFAKAAGEAQRIGYSLNAITGLADRLVGDFEGALRTQAELTTFFPGMDMGEVMFASQFGSLDDIATSVRNMITGAGFDQESFRTMPRSFKMMLTRGLGLSASELANILGVDPEELMDVSQREQISAQERLLKSVFDLSEGGIGTIIKILRSMLLVINPFSSLLREPINATEAIKQGNTVGMYGIPVPVRAPKHHMGLLPNEYPAILQKGEAVLTPKMLNNVANIVSSAVTMADNVVKPVVMSEKTPTKDQGSSVVVIDTAKLEDLLKQLINVTREGKVIELDGRQVGKTIVDAHVRHG